MGMEWLPASSRPREKLLAHGASALSDAELLALLLRTGTAGKGVLTLADEVLQIHGGVASLLQAAAAPGWRVKGIGPAKRAELGAVLELTRRALQQQLALQPAMNQPQEVADYVRLHIGDLAHEVFAVLYLDTQHRLLRMEQVFRGTLAQATVYPREIAKEALQHHAAAVVVAHNHPSGCAEPSGADITLTQHLQQALALIDVRLLDHLVVTRHGHVSLKAKGLL